MKKGTAPIFHIDEKITLNTWACIATRPSYISSVDPEECRHACVTAVYSFEEQTARCGISNCLETHGQGFLVSISDHKETNVCEGCGQRLFSVTFEDQQKALQDKARVTEQRARLNTLLQQSDAIKGRVKDLKRERYGTNWLYRSLTNFRKTYPAELLATLSKLAVKKEDDGVLNALIEDKIGLGRLEQVTQLRGLGIFATDIRETLIENILKPMIQLEEIAKDVDPKQSVSRYCQWAGSLDEQFAHAEYLVKEGQAFFDSENLERLKSIPLSENSARLVRSVQWRYDKGMAKRK